MSAVTGRSLKDVSVLLSFPWLIVSFILYNAIAFSKPQYPAGKAFAQPFVLIKMPSSEVWAISLGDMLIFLTVTLLFAELLKSTRKL